MQSDLLSLYWVIVAAGFVLIAAEIFIPGGILGVIGILSLITAALMGFSVFGAKGGLISALGILIGGALFLFLWIKYCPKSIIGHWFTLAESGKDFKSFDDSLNHLAGKSGVAQSDLRPSGIALIESKKVDVLSEAGFISRGTPVKVMEVIGGRVIVRQIESSDP